MTAGGTGAEALVDALRDAGVALVFGNLGSDHPAIIEALAEARARGEESPAVVLAPHEASALTAAHGYALVTGRAQAVFVHVDVGTANLGGGVHNAARAKVPVLVFAGLTPYTLEGELPGTRNMYPNHLQDVADQHALVRPYAKWSYDLRTGANARQVVLRALQLAESAPRGPVYLTAAREVLAGPGAARAADPALWRPVEPIPAPDAFVEETARAIAGARFPILVTSSLGRREEAVDALVGLADAIGLGVVQPVPSAMNFPSGHPMHLGYSPEALFDRADLVLVVDSDAPWMMARAAPTPGTPVVYVDDDPLKERIPLWYVESERFVRADSAVFLDQLRAAVERLTSRGDVAGRRAAMAAVHADQQAVLAREATVDTLSAATVAATLARIVDDETIVLNEAISNADAVFRHLPRRVPGTLYASGGSSLGWAGGAAIGVKLARPDADVVAIVGDGTYFLSSPASNAWMAREYDAPSLTIVLDNGGWNATKQNVVRQHAGGAAATDDRLWVSLGGSADFGGIAAAAGGARAFPVERLAELEPALRAALDAIRGGSAAVVTVRLQPISRQRPDEAIRSSSGRREAAADG